MTLLEAFLPIDVFIRIQKLRERMKPSQYRTWFSTPSDKMCDSDMRARFDTITFL
jgi:hypothetical protein